MYVCIVIFLLYLFYLVDVQGIEEDLLLVWVLCRGEVVTVDVDETVVEVCEVGGGWVAAGDVDDEEVTRVVYELFGTGQGFARGHEAQHLNEHPRLQMLQILLRNLTPTIQRHRWDPTRRLSKKVMIIELNRMISLIKRQHTRLKLLRRLHRPQHGIKHLIIKRLPNIKLNDQLSLRKCLRLFQMINFHIILNIF